MALRPRLATGLPLSGRGPFQTGSAKLVRSNGHAAFGWLWSSIEQRPVSATVIRPIRELSCDAANRQPADGKGPASTRSSQGEHIRSLRALVEPWATMAWHQWRFCAADSFVRGATAHLGVLTFLGRRLWTHGTGRDSPRQARAHPGMTALRRRIRRAARACQLRPRDAKQPTGERASSLPTAF